MTYNIGVVGSGYFSEKHLEAISANPRLKLLGIFSRNLNRGKELSKKYNCQYWPDYQTVIQNNQLDVLDICNLNIDHTPFAIQAIKNKINVIVEKPAGINLGEIEELEQNLLKYKVIGTVALQKRYGGMVPLIKSWLKKHEQNITQIESTVYMPRDSEYYSDPNKSKKSSTGGGVVIHQAIHYLDLIIQIFGKVDKVSSTIRNIEHQIEVEDTADVVLNYSSGPIHHFHASTATRHSPLVQTTVKGDRFFIVFNERNAVMYENKYAKLLKKDPLNTGNNNSILKKVKLKLGLLSNHIPTEIMNNCSRGHYSDVLDDFLNCLDNKNKHPIGSVSSVKNLHWVIDEIYGH